MNEAIYQAAAYTKAQAKSDSRRVIIILNDGLSNAAFKSSHSEREAFAQLSESDATVCGLIEGSRRSDVARAVNLVPWVAVLSALYPPGNTRKYIAQTGGEAFEVSKGDIAAMAAELLIHLRQRYTLGYVPSDQRMDGKFRTIKVKLQPEREK